MNLDAFLKLSLFLSHLLLRIYLINNSMWVFTDVKQNLLVDWLFIYSNLVVLILFSTSTDDLLVQFIYNVSFQSYRIILIIQNWRF